MRVEREGKLMNVTLTKEEVEDAVVLWLRQKHGLEIAPADVKDEKKKYSMIHFRANDSYTSRVEVTVTLVHGAAPPSEQPYR